MLPVSKVALSCSLIFLNSLPQIKDDEWMDENSIEDLRAIIENTIQKQYVEIKIFFKLIILNFLIL